VFLLGERIVGYLRRRTAGEDAVLACYTAGGDAARAVLTAAASRGAAVDRILVHPRSKSAFAFASSECVPFAGALACPLVPGALDAYSAAIERDPASLGALTLPPAFEVR
jgi:hypothetical protein